MNLRFFARPCPLGGRGHVADDRLPALGDVDVLNDHALFALRAVIFERLDLIGERARELVKGRLGAVLLREIVSVGEVASGRHRRVVDRAHLRRQHRLDLIARLDPLHDGEHEIRPAFVRARTL